MSLYDDIDIQDAAARDKKSDVSGWGSSLKMLQVQQKLQAKNKSQQREPAKKRGSVLAPVIDLKRMTDENPYPLTFNHQTGKLERMVPGSVAAAAAAGGSGAGGSGAGGGAGGPPGAPSMFLSNEPQVSSLTGVVDEYDPFRPNEYEEFQRRRREQRKRERREEKQKQEEAMETERQERRKKQTSRFDDDEVPFERRRGGNADSSDDEEDKAKEQEKRNRGGAAIAPPAMLIENVPPPTPRTDRNSEASPLDFDIDGRAMDDDSPPRPSFGVPNPKQHGLGPGRGSDVAAKIMAKFGYQQGQGLGKSKQGMATALQVEKTSKRGGRIIDHRNEQKNIAAPPVPNNAELLKCPSKVVCLRNMVGPGDVDEDLEAETGEECGKYGKVAKCLIFEIPNVEPEESVRIFVEFETMASAIKALVDLNGRFFGGRAVRACFYNLDKFRRLDLADEVI